MYRKYANLAIFKIAVGGMKGIKLRSALFLDNLFYFLVSEIFNIFYGGRGRGEKIKVCPLSCPSCCTKSVVVSSISLAASGYSGCICVIKSSLFDGLP